jgi:hypothetical protein
MTKQLDQPIGLTDLVALSEDACLGRPRTRIVSPGVV